MQSQRREVQGDLSREVKNELGGKHHAHVCKKVVKHDFSSRVPRILLLTKTENVGASVQEIPTPSTFSCWKIKFQTQVSDAISPGGYVVDRRSKEVEMVDKKASRSIHGEDFPNFEMLDARIASA